MQTGKIVLLFFLLAVITNQLCAQEFGGNPPSLHWKQVNTDTVRVIFHPGFEKTAALIAAKAAWIGKHTLHSIGAEQKKINIVLQDLNILSNAYVGLGPYRSEFYLTPPQNSFDLGSIPWPESLVNHEYRHVMQYNNFRVGLSRALYYLAGEMGQALANSAAIPNWFWEGDAVAQETLLSSQGRGRMPSFFDGYRSLWAAHKDYSWMKLRNGSLRDYVPDHYPLGYMMIAYGRNQYGDDFWRKVSNDAARYRGLFYPFQRAIKKYSGIDYRQFRSAGLNAFLATYSDSPEDSISKVAAADRHFYGDELYPQWMDDNHIVLLKSDYSHNPAFVIRNLPQHTERKLGVKDISYDRYFSYGHNQLVYSGWHPDIRWGRREYSDIRLLDIETGQRRWLTRKARYFSPAMSADGKSLLAVWVDPGGAAQLHMLSAENGHLIRTFPNKDELFITYPQFYGTDAVVAAVRNNAGKMALMQWNISTGHQQVLIPFSFNQLAFLRCAGDTISFTASLGNRVQLFLLANHQLWLADPYNINHKTGNYQLSVWQNKMTWTAFSATGSRAVYADDSRPYLQKLPIDTFVMALPDMGMHWLDTAIDKDGFRNTSAAMYPVTPYKATHGLFHFHSWLPDINDPDYSLSLLGENVLNTMQQELYFTYNRNEGSKQLGYRVTYGGWFPWVRLGTDFTFDRQFDLQNKIIPFKTWESYAGVSIPLDFSGGRYYRNLQFTTDYVYNRSLVESAYKDSIRTGVGYLRSSLRFSNQVQQARKQIYPRWAQTLLVYAYGAMSDAKGRQVMGSAYWYFPGLAATHSLVLNTAIHLRDTLNEVRFTNSFPLARGYTGINYQQMYKIGLNYHFPLVYPDWGLADIVYFLRLRANLFYDYTRVRDYDNNHQRVAAQFRSFGAELFFDTRWWNEHPVSFGIRYSRLSDGVQQGLGANRFEFILPVNLLQR